MHNKARNIRLGLGSFPLLVLLLATSGAVVAQDPVPVDADGNSIVLADDDVVRDGAIDAQLPLFTSTELEQFVGPIALYPDSLLAIILPASTYPLQIVLAARFLEQLETDSTLTPDESLDDSVIALLNYPLVIQMMNENIQWTWQLGEAVVSQESDVLTAITSFRELAYAAGNLKSDAFQEVSGNDDSIVITQASETVVYVPYYVPEEVIVYQSEPVYHYYPTAYPVYYYPYAADHHFRSSYFWGVTTAFTLGWWDHHLHVYHHSYSRHPYYGHDYYSGHNYRRRNIGSFNRSYVNNSYRVPRDRARDGSYWRPQRNSGVRPLDRRYDNRIYSADDPRSVSIGRRGSRGGNRGDNIGLNNNRADRLAGAATTNNNRRTEIAGETPRRQSNRRQTDRSDGPVANAFANTPVGNNTPTAASRARVEGDAFERRGRGNGRPSDDRGDRLDRSAATASVVNNRNAEDAPQRPGNRRQSDRNGSSVANAFNSPLVPAATNPPSSIERIQAETRAGRAVVDDRQGSRRIGSREGTGNAASIARTSLNRQVRAGVSPTGERTIVSQSTPGNSAIVRANRQRNVVKPSRRVAPVETQRRVVRQAPTRQRAAPQSRSVQPARASSRSSAPAAGRSARPPAQSARSSSSSRSSARPSSSSRSAARPASSSRSTSRSSSSARRASSSSARAPSQNVRRGGRTRRDP